MLHTDHTDHTDRWVWWDPRHYQILCLTALLVYGWLGLDFDIRPLHAGVMLATALVFQWVCSRFWKIA